jgi:hypothetical protein
MKCIYVCVTKKPYHRIQSSRIFFLTWLFVWNRISVTYKRGPTSRGSNAEGGCPRARRSISFLIERQEEGDMNQIAFAPFYLIPDLLQNVKDGNTK